MPRETVLTDPVLRQRFMAERERVRALARGRHESPQDASDAFPQPLERVMAIQDHAARHTAALEHMRILCRNIRAKDGVQDLQVGRARLSEKARKALDASISVFRRNGVLSDDELNHLLSVWEEPIEQRKAA